jgi:multidrug efflux system membrane fusion protein
MASDSLQQNGSRVSPDSDQAGSFPPRRKRSWLWFLVIVVVVGGTFGIYKLRNLYQAQAAAKQGQGVPSVPVAVAAVEKRDVPVYLRGLGSVTAFNTVTVRSRIDGQLLQVAFREGQFVHAGDMVAQIDPRPYEVALEQAQGQLARDQAQLTAARLDLGRFDQLLHEGVISQQQYDAQKATVGQLEGAIRVDQAQIDNQKLQLTYCRITAPLSGRIGLRLVDQGNMVHAADPSGLLIITQVQPIAVVFTIPEDNLPEVTRHMRGAELQVEAYDRDDKTKLAVGKLITVDNQIDQTTGAIRLKAVFDNNDMSLWPNQFVNIRLLLRVQSGAIAVPSAAIQRGAQGPFVYVVRADNRAEVRPVQIDFTEGNATVVSSGLAVGEQVVVDGQDKLQAGTKVEPRPASGGGPRPCAARQTQAP